MLETDFILAREHMIYQILNSSINGYPYPHSHIEDFFPSNFYEQIQDNMISRKDLGPISKTGKVGLDEEDIYKDRYVMPMTSKKMDNLSGSQRIFWENMSELLNCIELRTVLLHSFQPLVDERLGLDQDSISFNTDADFVQDLCNYNIGPHTDHPANIIAMLIYLPRTDEHVE